MPGSRNGHGYEVLYCRYGPVFAFLALGMSTNKGGERPVSLFLPTKSVGTVRICCIGLRKVFAANLVKSIREELTIVYSKLSNMG